MGAGGEGVLLGELLGEAQVVVAAAVAVAAVAVVAAAVAAVADVAVVVAAAPADGVD